jgi:phosphonopyruvate decarboxylase
MLQAEVFLQAAKAKGFRLFTGVPCSYLKPFINYVIDAPDLAYIGAANEGDAIAIAAGAEFTGCRSVVMFQNSGLGNTVNPLTSLNAIFRIPCLLITTWRGEPGGEHDEPQHELMGQITPKMLELMNIPWEHFPKEDAHVAPVLTRAVQHMDETGLPYALIMQKDAVAPYKLKTTLAPKPLSSPPKPANWAQSLPWRADILKTVQETAGPNAALIATTGFTGRSLYALEDKKNQIYLVGSMGCASSIGLGLAWAQPNRQVVVLDGDGAALMRLGAFSTVGYERPKNLVHLLLDNESHESTGGQSTVSHSVDLAQVAYACGYPTVLRASYVEELREQLSSLDSLTFIHVKIRPGERAELPRPSVTPQQVARRFRHWLQEDK